MNKKNLRKIILSLTVIGMLGIATTPKDATAQITKEATVMASEKRNFSSATQQWGAPYDQRYKSIYFRNGYEALEPTTTDTYHPFSIERLYTYHYYTY